MTPGEAFPYIWERISWHLNTLLSFLVVLDMQHRFGPLVCDSWLSFPKARQTEWTLSENQTKNENICELLCSSSSSNRNVIPESKSGHGNTLLQPDCSLVICLRKLQGFLFVRKFYGNYTDLQKASNMIEQKKPWQNLYFYFIVYLFIFIYFCHCISLFWG